MHRSSPPLGEAFDGAARPPRAVTLLDVYERGTTLEDLYQLAEQLITWDERVILWRFHHLKVVERIIGGSVIGTQGTPVEVLGKRIDVRFYPRAVDGPRRDHATIAAGSGRPRRSVRPQLPATGYTNARLSARRARRARSDRCMPQRFFAERPELAKPCCSRSLPTVVWRGWRPRLARRAVRACSRAVLRDTVRGDQPAGARAAAADRLRRLPVWSSAS